MSPDHRKSDKDRLEDIRAALDKVDSYVAQGREEFERNELLQGWMVFQLLVVGEAASASPESYGTVGKTFRGEESST